MKRFASPITTTDPAARVLAAALVAAVLATLLLLYAPRGASAQEMPAGMEAGKDGVSINGGEVFAGAGCARAGDVVAGDCSDGRDREGGRVKGSGSDEGGGETTQSRTIESTTGVVEESEEDADADVDPGTAGGEFRPEGADEGCAVDGPVGETTMTTVERAVDGDTFETTEGTVRLVGVDTPETVDPGEPAESGGAEASEFTATALEGEEVALEIGTEPEDDYGRTLAYLWTEDGAGEPVMFNETLLRKGMGELLIISPNDEYERCLAAAEKLAREEGAGMWAENEDVPWETTAETTTPETTGADTTPLAEEGQDGLLESIFGGGPSEDAAGDQYAGELASPETTAGEGAAEDQYENEGASEPRPPAITGEPEVQEPEIQEEEIQDPEIQEEEIQEPEVQDPPVRNDELTASTPPLVTAEVPVEASAELSANDAQYPIQPAPASPAGPAHIATLPETGGASLPTLALLPMGALLACSGLVAAGLTRPGRRAGSQAARRERSGG